MEKLITKKSDLETFELIVKILLHSFDTKFTEKLDGPDQSYYDFILDNTKYTLHREHYTGISIISDSKNNDFELIVKEISNQISI
ncbi:DUF3630 family protein [Leptospira sp. WS60.C2]